MIKLILFNIGKTFKNKLIWLVIIIVSLSTFYMVNHYNYYMENLNENQYNEAFLKYGEKNFYGEISNEDMEFPIVDELEHKEQAIENLIMYLTIEAEKGNIKESSLEIIKKQLINSDLEISEIEDLVYKNTRMTGIFSFIYEDTNTKNVGYKDYNVYVQNLLDSNGKQGFYFKYVEFFLLFLVASMIIFIPLNYRFLAEEQTLEVLKYRNQLKFKSLFADVISKIFVFFLILQANSVFYYFYIGTSHNSIINAFIFPNILLVPIFFLISLCLLINVAFKKWYISILIIIGMMLYSNMPVIEGQQVIWKLKPFSILIRYGKTFWTNTQHQNLYLHETFMVALGILILIITSRLIRRKSNAL